MSRRIGGRARGWGRLAVLAATLMLVSGCAREPVAVQIARGQDALRRGDYPVAADYLRRAARAKPDSMVLHYNLGMAELGNGRLPKAVVAFERAAALTTDGATDALEGLARAKHLQQRWDDANRAYEQAIAKAGRLPRILAAMAATELKRGRGEMALRLLMEALAQTPDDPTALFNMACVQREAFQDLPAAAAYFTRFLAVAPATEAAARSRATTALESMPKVRPSTSARAETLIMRSRKSEVPAEAAALAEQAASEDPLSADAAWNVATTLQDRVRDRDRAAREFARFARLFPADPRVARIPAPARSATGDQALSAARAAAASSSWATAIAAYRRLLAADARNADLWLEFSDVARSAGDSAAALEAATKALGVQANSADALYRIAFLHYQQGQQAKAIEFYRRYLQQAPESPQKDAVRQWLRSAGG